MKNVLTLTELLMGCISAIAGGFLVFVFMDVQKDSIISELNVSERTVDSMQKDMLEIARSNALSPMLEGYSNPGAAEIKSALVKTYNRMSSLENTVRMLSYENERLSQQLYGIRIFQGRSKIETAILTLRPELDRGSVYTLASAIILASFEYSHDPLLLTALIYVESSFRQGVISDKGAISFGQIMPLWVGQIPFINTEDDLFNPMLNIMASAYVLDKYRSLTPDVETALLSYNRGVSAVKDDMKRNIDPDNGYPDRVMEIFYRLSEIPY